MAYDPAYHRAYYLNNRTKKIEQAQAYAVSRKEQKAEYDQSRRIEHGDKLRAYDHDRYLKARRWSCEAMFQRAKTRAARDGVPFSITKSDIVIPETCPALGIPLFGKSGSGGGGNSPSLDRIIPHLGYIPGNVIVISAKANMIKSNATPTEIHAVALWLDGVLKARPIPPAGPRCEIAHALP